MVSHLLSGLPLSLLLHLLLLLSPASTFIGAAAATTTTTATSLLMASPSVPHALDYEANAYITVTISPSSSFAADPRSLENLNEAINHVGQVGALSDVQLLSVPQARWSSVKQSVLGSLNSRSGILRIDVQEPRQRRKRDEF